MDASRLLARAALLGLDLALLGLALTLVRLLTSAEPAPLTLPGLAMILCTGTAVTVLSQRWERTRLARLLGVLGVGGVSLLLIKGGLGGGYGPLGGWDVLARALFGSGEIHAGAAYGALLLALLAGWRGTRLLVPTVPAEVQRRFKRGLLVLVVLLAAAALVPLADPGAARQAGTLATIA